MFAGVADVARAVRSGLGSHQNQSRGTGIRTTRRRRVHAMPNPCGSLLVGNEGDNTHRDRADDAEVIYGV